MCISVNSLGDVEAIASIAILVAGFGVYAYRRYQKAAADGVITLDEAVDVVEDITDAVVDLNDDVTPLVDSVIED